ncbi:MAG: thiamine pyrophosphate-binding protein [Solirubrobacteraceae bacterium]
MTDRPDSQRTGGHVVVESLEALGARAAFGIPGTHTLSIWECLRMSPLRSLVLRTELSAGFAAEGYARVSGQPAPLLLTTGPGALMSLAPLMEAAAAHTPLVAIASQIPSSLIGRRRGYLHELPDQLASFTPIVKWATRVQSGELIPEVLAEAWRRAQTPPSGPVFVEVPVDVLRAPALATRPQELRGEPPAFPVAAADAVGEAATLLSAAKRPVLWAGGGVLRSGAWAELAELAELLQSPVATTYMGKGAFPDDHPLAVGSSCDEPAFRRLLAEADVVLCIGTELGAETTGHWALEFSGRLIQVDAAAERIGLNYPALGLVGDARRTLEALVKCVRPANGDGAGQQRASELRREIEDGLERDARTLEPELLRTIGAALPRDAVQSWDMTTLAYWAAAFSPALTPRRFLYPLGSGSLGYGWPAALGATAALPRTPVLAVVGDGGFSYGLADLATARQHGSSVVLLIIDDGGYGILRSHQQRTYGNTHAVDLPGPDFAALMTSFGVPVRAARPESLAQDLQWAFAVEGPATVVLAADLEIFPAAAGWASVAPASAG